MHRLKHNPAFLGDDELAATFVARRPDLDLLLSVVRDNTTSSNQHVLILGPRGAGKTTLALRLGLAVRRAEELKERWFPIVFSEENYEATTPGEFWLQALFHLSQRTKDNRLEQTHSELRAETDETRLRERALARLLEFSEIHNKRLLLVVENLNMLLADQVSEDDAWTLRHALLNEPQIMLVATATSSFNQVESADQAMFEVFKRHELLALDSAECREIWKSVNGADPGASGIRPMQIFTGGNPRLLTIMASHAAHFPFKQLMKHLAALVDDQTDYFKSNLEALPVKERKVFLALSELWHPATARQVVTVARLRDVNTASALLNRLVGRGAVIVDATQPRRKLYAVSEPLHNIYYQMRRRGAPSRRVRALVDFMVGFYGNAEFDRQTRSAAAAADGAPRQQLKKALALARRSDQKSESPWMSQPDMVDLFLGLAARDLGPEAIEILEQAPRSGMHEPLLVGLRLALAAEVLAPREFLEVGRDVRARIDALRKGIARAELRPL